MYSPTLMNNWTRFIEKWFSESQIAFTDYGFNTMKQELSVGFDELTEDFDRVLNDELEFSEPYVRIRSENITEVILLHRSYALNPSNKNTRNKTRKRVRPVSVRRHNHLNSKIPSSTAEREGRELFEDLIVTDENIKVVLQLPSNNQRENIQIIAYNDNSVSISFLSSKGKRSSRTLALPYGIDLETARSTYRNRILEITFNRK
jgi:HSP20 family molecular chaperone IbpA